MADPLACAPDPNLAVRDIFPGENDLQNRANPCSNFCDQSLTPLHMSAIFMKVLTNHFSDTSNLLSPGLKRVFAAGGYVDTPATGEATRSPLFVDTLDRWQPTQSESRPALLVKEGDWVSQPAGLRNAVGVDLQTGAETYASTWSGGHVIFALAPESAMAKQLAVEVMQLFQAYSSSMVSLFGLHMFRVSKLASATHIRESYSTYVVPIDLIYVLQMQWKITPHAPRVKQIKLKVSELNRNY